MGSADVSLLARGKSSAVVKVSFSMGRFGVVVVGFSSSMVGWLSGVSVGGMGEEV